MAPNGCPRNNSFCKTPRFSIEGLHRTVSDISFELSREAIDPKLPTISEVEDAKCECCGMSEEYTPEYIQRVRDKFSGKWICGLCSEAVKEEVEKNGGRGEEGLNSHMKVCVRFNRIGRSYPALFHADAMREILKKSTIGLEGRGVRADKTMSHRDRGRVKKGGIARSSSCIPAIPREMTDLKTVA